MKVKCRFCDYEADNLRDMVKHFKIVHNIDVDIFDLSAEFVNLIEPIVELKEIEDIVPKNGYWSWSWKVEDLIVYVDISVKTTVGDNVLDLLVDVWKKLKEYGWEFRGIDNDEDILYKYLVLHVEKEVVL